MSKLRFVGTGSYVQELQFRNEWKFWCHINMVFKTNTHHICRIRRHHVWARPVRECIDCETLLWADQAYMPFVIFRFYTRFYKKVTKKKKKDGSQKYRNGSCPSFCSSLVHKMPLQKILSYILHIFSGITHQKRMYCRQVIA